MRLKSLTATGFRGFSEEVTLDLDADAVIVSGVNGTGKTSMFDAILWALTGSIERLHASPADLINKYSPSGEARVQLVLERIDRAPVIIVRRFDGDTHLSVDGGESEQAVGAANHCLSTWSGQTPKPRRNPVRRCRGRSPERCTSNRISCANSSMQTANRIGFE